MRRPRVAEKSCVGAEALGRSRGGLSTKMHGWRMSGAGRCTSCWVWASSPIARGPRTFCNPLGKTDKVLANEVYDANRVLAAVATLGVEAPIRSFPHWRVVRPVNLVCYRQCNQLERLMSRSTSFAAWPRAMTKRPAAISSSSAPCSGSANCSYNLVSSGGVAAWQACCQEAATAG